MKIERQAKIVEIVSKNDIETQDEISELLIAEGFDVTQATISRDIRELKLTKVTIDGGKQKYIVLKNQEEGLGEKYIQVLKNAFISMDMAQNILVIRTVSGMAMAVGASIDSMHINGIVGCIAGDDTVMCAVRTAEETISVMEKLKKMLNSRLGGMMEEIEE